MIYKKNLGIMLSKVDGEFYAVYEYEAYKLNETGARIIELCDGKNTDSDIAVKLSKHFKIEFDEIKNDIDVYLSNLNDMGLIKIKSNEL